MIKAIIFDFDGVIADTFEIAYIAFRDALKEFGVCLDRDLFTALRIKGVGLYDILRLSAESTGIRLSKKQLDEIAEIKTRIQLGMMDNMELFQGVGELLKTLHGRFRLALGTANTSALIKPYFEKKKIDRYFEEIVSSKEVPRTKPEPDLFLEIARRLNVRPDECAVFEDSLGGLTAAKNAGMRVIAVATGETSFEELGKLNPDLIVKDLTEKEKIMDFINKAD